MSAKATLILQASTGVFTDFPSTCPYDLCDSFGWSHGKARTPSPSIHTSDRLPALLGDYEWQTGWVSIFFVTSQM